MTVFFLGFDVSFFLESFEELRLRLRLLLLRRRGDIELERDERLKEISQSQIWEYFVFNCLDLMSNASAHKHSDQVDKS